METTFKAVEFARHDVITREVLDTLQANNQWVHDNTPRTRQTGEDGSNVDVMGVIVGGRVRIPRSKKDATSVQKVVFGQAFHPVCTPNVTTGVVSESERQIFCVVNGPDGHLLPNAAGFDIKVNVEDSAKPRWKIPKEFFVYWQAFGFRWEGIYDL